MKILVLSLNLLLLCSCGYQTVASEDRPTISIPYVRGDEEGFLTNAVLAEMSRTGLYDLVNSNGELELKIAIVGKNDETVGYRFERTEKRSKLRPNLLATESRRNMAAEVTLYRASEDQPILGPIVVSASADYDYVDVSTLRELAFVGPSGKLEKVIDFSEGQLDSVEGAQDNVLQPLFQDLAHKIAAVIQKHYFKRPLDGSSKK